MTKSKRSFLSRFRRNEDGHATIEFAIMVPFLFVIMLLGVDESIDLQDIVAFDVFLKLGQFAGQFLFVFWRKRGIGQFRRCQIVKRPVHIIQVGHVEIVVFLGIYILRFTESEHVL